MPSMQTDGTQLLHQNQPLPQEACMQSAIARGEGAGPGEAPLSNQLRGSRAWVRFGAGWERSRRLKERPLPPPPLQGAAESPLPSLCPGARWRRPPRPPAYPDGAVRAEERLQRRKPEALPPSRLSGKRRERGGRRHLAPGQRPSCGAGEPAEPASSPGMDCYTANWDPLGETAYYRSVPPPYEMRLSLPPRLAPLPPLPWTPPPSLPPTCLWLPSKKPPAPPSAPPPLRLDRLQYAAPPPAPARLTRPEPGLPFLLHLTAQACARLLRSKPHCVPCSFLP